MKTLRRPQAGFNLIEALIAMVVLTVGLLGIAAMQLTGLRNTQGSYFRSQATTVMNDLAERIYANTAGAVNYGGFDSSAVNACTAPAATCAMESTAAITQCTPAQMAAYDRFVAGCSAANGARNLLPAGQLTIDCLDAASGVVTACAAGLRMRITVNWQESAGINESASAGATSASNQSISLVIQP